MTSLPWRRRRKTEFYKDSAGKWRWRVRDLTNRIHNPDGEIIAASSQGFSSKRWAKFNYDLQRELP